MFFSLNAQQRKKNERTRNDKENLESCTGAEKNERKRNDKENLDLARELKKLWDTKVTVTKIVVGHTQRFWKKTSEIENQRKNQDHTDICIVKNG